MKSTEVFRIYNLKFIKKNKLNTILTVLSVFLCLTVCLVTPVIKYYYEKNINQNIKDINGGDLAIFLRGNESKELKDKVKEKKDEGLKVTEKYITSTAYMMDKKQIAGRLIFENDKDLKDNEITLSESLAEELKLSKGDNIKFKLNDSMVRYKIKNIESISKGVDRDADSLGFGRINLNAAKNKENMSLCIYISGKNGEELKKEFQKIDNKNQYVTLKDKKEEMQDNIVLESTVLNVLSSVSLTLTLVSIAVSIFMNVLKRKKDIGTMKLISVKNKDIEKAMFLEITLVILVPLIMASLLSLPLGKAFLSYKGINQDVFNIGGILIVLKGFVISLLMSWICIFFALRLCNKIKAIDIVHDDEDRMMKAVRTSILKFVLILPIIVVIYGIINKDPSFIASTLIIMGIVLAFLLFVFILIKIVSGINYRNKTFLYTFKNIRKNSFIFIFTVLSLAITITFILIGYYLKSTVSTNINKVVGKTLPYNYEIIPDGSNFDDKGITSSDKVEGYDKTYGFDGELLNKTKSTMFNDVGVEEINKKDYKAKFKIAEGANLFEKGDGNVIISDAMYNKCGFHLGDTLDIKYKDQVLHFKIKGVYKSAGINDITLYKENKELSQSKKSHYLVMSHDSSFLEDIDECIIWNMGDIGKRMIAPLEKFLKVFKILSIITVISIIIVNINVTNMSESLEKKNNEIVMALGMGKNFIFKSRIIKIIANSILASFLSIGIFAFGVKSAMALMFKHAGKVNIETILILCSLSLVFSLLSYIFNLKVYDKSYELIRSE